MTQDKEYIRKYVIANGATMTAKEIKQALGSTTAIVYQFLKEAGIKPKKKNPIARKQIDKERDFILANYQELSIDQLVAKTGLSERQVQGILSSRGLQCTVLDSVTKTIFAKYKTSTVKNLSYLTGVSITKVYSIMHKYGLEPCTQVNNGWHPGKPIRVKSFANHIEIPIGFRRMSVMVPADASSEYIIDRKNRLLSKFGVAV